jgi:hypothetical protein
MTVEFTAEAQRTLRMRRGLRLERVSFEISDLKFEI